MKKLLLFILCITALSDLSAQQDFYIVDSLYCHSHNGGAATPTERQYNLSFSQRGEVLESRKEQYLTWLGQWRNLSHLNYEYNNQGDLVKQTEQRWDTLVNAWVNFARVSNTPNANGDYTEVLNETWNGQTWLNVDKVKSAFGMNGVIESLTQQVWENGAWRNNLRIIYASNMLGKFVLTKFQLWSTATDSFYDVNRQTYFYDAVQPELEVKQITEVYNQFEMRWDSSSQLLKAYDSQGNMTEQATQLWSPVDSSWTNSSRNFQNFNAEGDVTLRTEFIWNGSQWVNFFQVNNVYDTVANLTRFEVSQWDVMQWKLLTTCDFYPHLIQIILTANEPLEQPCNWPNPYRLGMPVQCPNLAADNAKQLAVYDLSGRLLHSQNIEKQEVVELDAALPTGFYIVKINGNNGLFAPQKIMITN
ncbi:MAG: T9SS type A sorting domain-containing protein [Saprospiraceae bacterium]|nr:T9SS type A sorting domain-containing protein [Saprospiraceae bacterium]